MTVWLLILRASSVYVELVTKRNGPAASSVYVELVNEKGAVNQSSVRRTGHLICVGSFWIGARSLRDRGNDLSSFEKLGGPILPFQGPFDLTGRFTDPALKIYRTSSLKANFGDNDISGWMELNFSKERPLVKVELSSQKLDLRPFLAKAEKHDS